MDKEGFSCVILWFFAIPCLTILLIIDSVLFFGSICPECKVILIIGMVLNTISILSFIGIVFFSISFAKSASNSKWESVGYCGNHFDYHWFRIQIMDLPNRNWSTARNDARIRARQFYEYVGFVNTKHEI